jgi:cob(I)alamin adenosyltransferase
MKIYTRTGDKGETSLIDGSRVPKHHLRVAAYGDVDELNAALGIVRTQLTDEKLGSLLHEIQQDLFAFGAQLADPTAQVGSRQEKANIGEGRVARLEQEIDACDAELPPLRAFILPGGSPAGAFLHLARTVCRRAERSLVTLSSQTPLAPVMVEYLNRLSDLLFVLARKVNHAAGQREQPW